MLGHIAEQQLFDEYIEQAVTSVGIAKRIVRATTIDQSVESAQATATAAQQAISEAQIPVDDGTPPPSITALNPQVSLGLMSLSISNDQPPWQEGVEYIEWQITRRNAADTADESVYTVQDPTATGIFVQQTPTTGPPKKHVLKARLRDMWGRFTPASGHTTVGTFTPVSTAAYDIDLAGSNIAGKLGFTSLDQMKADLADPTKNGLVMTKGGIAANRAAFLEAWIDKAYLTDAMIANLKADKITAGDLTANFINVLSVLNIKTGGHLGAGMANPPAGTAPDPLTAKTIFNAQGIGLKPVESLGPNQAVDTERASKITTHLSDGSAPWGHLTYFGPWTPPGGGTSRRGLTERVDGATGIEGQLKLIATSAAGQDPDGTRSASLSLLSAPSDAVGTAVLNANSRIVGDLHVTGTLTGGGTGGVVSAADIGDGELRAGVKVDNDNFDASTAAKQLALVKLAEGQLREQIKVDNANFDGSTAAKQLGLGKLAAGTLRDEIKIDGTNFDAGGLNARRLKMADIEDGAFPVGRIPDLGAGKITSGTFDDARIPNLAAGKTTSGVFDDARIPALAAGKITSGVFDDARIPNFAAGKIISGVFDDARIPNLAAGKITGGVFDDARIPNLAAGKITSGLLDNVRLRDDIPGAKLAPLSVPPGALEAGISVSKISFITDAGNYLQEIPPQALKPGLDGSKLDKGSVSWDRMHNRAPKSKLPGTVVYSDNYDDLGEFLRSQAFADRVRGIIFPHSHPVPLHSHV